MTTFRRAFALLCAFSVTHASAAPVLRAPVLRAPSALSGPASLSVLPSGAPALTGTLEIPGLSATGLPVLPPVLLPEAAPKAAASAAPAPAPRTGTRALVRFLTETAGAQREISEQAKSERTPASRARESAAVLFDRSVPAAGNFADHEPPAAEGGFLAGGARLTPLRLVPQGVKNAVPAPEAAAKKEDKKHRRGSIWKRWKLWLVVAAVLGGGIFGAYHYFSPRLDPVTPPDAVVIVDKSPYAMAEVPGASILRSDTDPTIALSGGDTPIRAFTIRADRKAAVSVSVDGSWKLWDLEHGKVYAPEHYPGKVRTALFAEEGRKLILVDENGTVRVTTLRTGEVQTIERSLESVLFDAISPDAQRVAVGTSDNQVHILELGAAKPTAFAVGGQILAVGSTESGEMVLTSAKGIVKLWKVVPGEAPTVVVEKYLPGLKVKGSALSRSGDRLIALAEMAGDQIVLAWRFGTQDVQMIMGYDFAGDDAQLASVAATPDGTSVAILAKDGRLWTWTPGGGDPVQIGKAASGSQVFYSKSGTVIWTADKTGRLQAWTVPAPSSDPVK